MKKILLQSRNSVKAARNQVLRKKLMEAILPHLQAHFQDLISSYRPYRHHVSPLVKYLGLTLDESQELAILLLLGSAIILLATILSVRAFTPAPKRQAAKPKSKSTKKKANKPKTADTTKEEPKQDSQNKTEKQPTVGQREQEKAPKTVIVKEESSEQVKSTEPQSPQGEEKQQQGEDKAEEKEEEKEEKEEETEEETVSPAPQKNAKHLESPPDESPGTRKITEETPEDEAQPATPLRRSSRVKSTPQKFSPSVKKRVRKVD